VLNLNTRTLDTPCRYGGEEFAVILPTTELLTARRVAERLRAAIEATAIPLETTTLHFTASLGLAIYTRHDRDSTEQFIACADQQLYCAKRDGRNRVCFAITPVENEAAQVSPDEKELLSRLFSDAPDSPATDSDAPDS
jgi:diguanylate cyclase (GGDEF)-like protein